MKQKIELHIPATLHYSALVRHMAEEVFHHIGFSKEWSDRLKLVVDELFMNANRYGCTEGKSLIHITFTYDDKSVVFAIADDGTGAKKVTADELKALIKNNLSNNDLTKTSGRGLAMISKLWTDKLDIKESTNGGVEVSFTKKIESTPPPPPPMMKVPIEVGKPVASTVKKQRKGPAFTVKLTGEIDSANIERVTLPIDQQITALPKGGTLVLDFAEINYINSTFIGHLASWYREAQDKGGQIIIKNTNSQIKDVLDLVGLSRVLGVES